MSRYKEFAEQVRKAPSDGFAEKVVRNMVAEVAEDCPMDMLVKLGQCILDYWKESIRADAQKN